MKTDAQIHRESIRHDLGQLAIAVAGLVVVLFFGGLGLCAVAGWVAVDSDRVKSDTVTELRTPSLSHSVTASLSSPEGER